MKAFKARFVLTIVSWATGCVSFGVLARIVAESTPRADGGLVFCAWFLAISLIFSFIRVGVDLTDD